LGIVTGVPVPIRAKKSAPPREWRRKYGRYYCAISRKDASRVWPPIEKGAKSFSGITVALALGKAASSHDA